MEDNGYISKKQMRWYLGTIIGILIAVFGFFSGWVSDISVRTNSVEVDVSSIKSQVNSIDSRTERIEKKLDDVLYIK